MAYTNDTKDASGKSINDYKADYAAAAEKGDAAGMAAANAGANAIRTSNGGMAEYATADINNVKAGGTSSIVSNPSAWDTGISRASSSGNSGGSSSYQAVGTHNDAGVSADDAALIAQYKAQYDSAKAAGDTAGMTAAHDAAEAVRSGYGYSGGADGSDYIALLQQQPKVQQIVQAAAATGSTNSYDLTEYLKQQAAARIESTLAGLKGAYEQSMAGYNDTLSRLPATYAAARNSAAATNAQEKRAFDERAAASGLNTGASGQAELARSSVYQGNLANINTAQSNAEADIALQKANLESQYQTAIQQAKANGDATLAEALYQELIRVQGLEREDNQLAQQYALQLAQLGAGYGDYSGLNGLGIDTSSYEAALSAAGSAYTPTFSQAQVLSAAKSGALTGNMLRDYNYYVYGDPNYSGVGTSALSASGGGGSGYNNGGLTAAQVKELQRYYGVTADGLWGVQSQLAAGGLSAAEAWAAYNSSAGNGTISYDRLSAKGKELVGLINSGTLTNPGLIVTEIDKLPNDAEQKYLYRLLGIQG